MVLGFLDQRTDPVDPLAVVDCAADAGDHLVDALDRHGARVDRLAAGRLLAQLRDVHVAEIGQHQRARDRRRGHAPACRPPAPLAPAPGAGARRTDAARRRPRAPDRGRRRRPGTAHGCRPGCRSRRRRAAQRARRARAAWSRPVRSRGAGRPPRRAARCARRCWRARISVGAISAAWRPASTTCGHGEQRDHGLARADIALEQAQHALAAARSRGSRPRARAAARQREGQGGSMIRAAAVAGIDPPAGRAAHARAHQRERQLRGEQLVIGEPRTERRPPANVASAPRDDGLREARRQRRENSARATTDGSSHSGSLWQRSAAPPRRRGASR